MSFLLSLLALATVQPRELRVLAVFNLTGSMASVDRPGLEGMRLAAEQIERHNRMHVVLVPIDGQSNVGHAANAVRRALSKRRFDAVVGLYDSDYALAVGAVAQRARVPFVTSGATLPGLTDKIGNYAFSACYDDEEQARALARFAWDYLRSRSVSVLADPSHTYTREISRAFPHEFTAIGGRWLMSINDPTPSEGAPLSFGSDCVFAGVLPNDAGGTVKRLRAKGYTGPILSGDGFDTPLLGKEAGLSAYKVFFSTHVAYDSPDPIVRRFVSDFTTRYKHAPESAAAALGYDTLRIVGSAASRTHGTTLRAEIAATQRFPGVTGTISYLPGRRHPAKPVTIVELLGSQKVFRALIDRT